MVRIAAGPRVRRSWPICACKALAGFAACPVAPQHVDQPVGADRLPPPQRQQGQQGPLLGAADRHQHAPSHHFELAGPPGPP